MGENINAGDKVGTIDSLFDVEELKKLVPLHKIKPRYLEARKEGAKGVFLGFMYKSNGKIYLIRHDDTGDIGAYQLSEVNW